MFLKNKFLLLSATCFSLFTTYVVNGDEVTDFVPVESNVDNKQNSEIDNFVQLDDSQMSYNESYDAIYKNKTLDGMNSEKPLERKSETNHTNSSSQRPVYTDSISSIRDYAYQTVKSSQRSTDISNSSLDNMDSKMNDIIEDSSLKVDDKVTDDSKPTDSSETKSEKSKGILKSIGKLSDLQNMKKPIGKITKLQHDLPATAIMNTKYGILTSLVLLVSGLVSLLYGYFRKYMEH